MFNFLLDQLQVLNYNINAIFKGKFNLGICKIKY